MSVLRSVGATGEVEARLGVAALVLLVRFKVSSSWLVVGGGAVGLAARGLVGG